MRNSDWSSDVCSSDFVDLEGGRRRLERRLAIVVDEVERIEVAAIDAAADRDIMVEQIGFGEAQFDRFRIARIIDRRLELLPHAAEVALAHRRLDEEAFDQIGRASCRERVCQYV